MKNDNIIPNDTVFMTFFYFMQERMNMFWHKYNGDKNTTDDIILKTYKFTNVYRACDRVSQYLINDVIYSDLDEYSPEDIMLRIFIFKIFNKIETWEYLKKEGHDIRYAKFNPQNISESLTILKGGSPIFNNAYIMAGSHHKYNYLRYKHEKWLTMVYNEIVQDGIIKEILSAKSLKDVYNRLHSCTFIGNFLAYQYAIDLNYSPYLNFDENSFVKAGVGAIRGIKKCFTYYGKNYEDAIYFTYDNMNRLRENYGYNDFSPLPGREPHLIDIQNCFCETDKYLREALPNLVVGNTRIKQKYRPSDTSINYKFPPKWGIKLHVS